MGPARAELVIATFFNFDPGLVRHAMDGVWDITTPAALLEARVTRRGRGVAPRHGRTRATRPTSRRPPTLARRRRRGGVPAPLGQAAVRRPRIAAVARRSAARAVARAVAAARVPRRHPHRGDDRRGHRRLRSAGHATPRRATSTATCCSRAARGPTTAGTRRSSRCRAKGHVDADGAFTDKGARQPPVGRGPHRRRRRSSPTKPLGDDGCERLRTLVPSAVEGRRGQRRTRLPVDDRRRRASRRRSTS